MPIFTKYSLSLEVKSGTKGSMQSMRLFLHEKNLGFGIRASLENFGKLDDTHIVPLYAMEIMLDVRSVIQTK